MAKIERVTENLIRKALQGANYEDPFLKITIEEQKSSIEAVQRLLSKASKTGGGGAGAPEFIISQIDSPDFVIVIECKAAAKDHESALVAKILSNEDTGEDAPTKTKRAARFAVDGALHYARF